MAEISENIPWWEPKLGQPVRQAVNAVLDSDYINDGPVTRDLEARVAAIAGRRHGIAATSCTASISLALMAAGIGPGDEVIVPDITFIATANAARLAGARVRLVDVDPLRLTLDPGRLAEAIGPDTRAVVAVDINGRAADYAGIEAVCHEHGLTLICDSAQGLGSRHGGRAVGSFGDAACFSFSGNKMFFAGQGGAIGYAKTVRGCTFFRNVADPAGPGGTLGLGGAVFSGTLEDSIVWNCGPIPLAPGMTVNSSNVEGGWIGAGTNNVNGDPRFASPATGDFTLTGGSASIDAANPSSALDPDGTPADQGMAPYTYGSIGTVYCTSNPNSTGAIATMNVRGETLLAFDTLRLESDNLPVGQFGFYLASPQQGFVPNLGGGQGNLCLGAPIVRLVVAPAGGVLNSGIGGQFRMRAHMPSLPSVDRPSPGETWHFQAWFRDGSSSDLTDGLQIAFTP